MDLATIIGFIAAFGIVATGILMGGPWVCLLMAHPFLL
jgi:flagellar motor component MotA